MAERRDADCRGTTSAPERRSLGGPEGRAASAPWSGGNKKSGCPIHQVPAHARSPTSVRRKPERVPGTQNDHRPSVRVSETRARHSHTAKRSVPHRGKARSLPSRRCPTTRGRALTKALPAEEGRVTKGPARHQKTTVRDGRKPELSRTCSTTRFLPEKFRRADRDPRRVRPAFGREPTRPREATSPSSPPAPSAEITLLRPARSTTATAPSRSPPPCGCSMKATSRPSARPSGKSSRDRSNPGLHRGPYRAGTREVPLGFVLGPPHKRQLRHPDPSRHPTQT